MEAMKPVPKRRARWYSPIAIVRSVFIRPRVYLGAAVGIAILVFLPPSITSPVRETTAWCLGAATYLILAFRLMSRCHSDRIKTRAGVQDDAGILILGLILLAIFSSFSAIFGLLTEAKGKLQIIDALQRASRPLIFRNLPYPWAVSSNSQGGTDHGLLQTGGSRPHRAS